MLGSRTLENMVTLTGVFRGMVSDPRFKAFLRKMKLPDWNSELALDPQNAEAHAVLGWLAMEYDRDLDSTARHLARACD